MEQMLSFMVTWVKKLKRNKIRCGQFHVKKKSQPISPLREPPSTL